MAQPAAHGAESAAIEPSGDARRYRDAKDSRRPPLRIRSWRAYWVTFLVIGSYLVLRLRARFHDKTWVQHALRTTHLRNARRIERTICGLQGLFIKVGQLISIMTNFLPEEFRRALRRCVVRRLCSIHASEWKRARSRSHR